MRGRRREVSSDEVRPSQSADEQAVRAAEAIVGRAWVERLLHYHVRMQSALAAGRETCRHAADRLAAEQRHGDARGIGAAHTALEHAIAAHDAIETASRQASEALQAALRAQTRSIREEAETVTTKRAWGGEPAAGAASGLPLGRIALWRGILQAARRARWRVLRRFVLGRAAGGSGPRQPS